MSFGLALSPAFARPDRRSRLRPVALVPARRRLGAPGANALFRLGDVAALALAAAAMLVSGVDWRTTALVFLAMAVGLRLAGLYGLKPEAALAWRWANALAALALAGAIVAAPLGLAGPGAVRGGLYWLLLQAPFVLILHAFWRLQAAAWKRQGRLTPVIAIVGASPSAARLVETLAASGEAAVVGVFDDRLERAPKRLAGVAVLGGVEALLAHRLLPCVDRIVIALPPRADARVRALAERLFELPNEVSLLVDGDERGAAHRLKRLAGRSHDADAALLKRAFDLVAGSLALLLAGPVMALTALAVTLDSPGPILFRQRRHGFNNETFEIAKFRSMRAEAADACAHRQVCAGDDRLTRVGRLIRAASLDELPQLFNVLKGEMSLVGPRPHAVGMKTGEEESARLVAGYAHRHRIKPGLTGWAAICGSRGPLASAADIARRVALDLEYIERQSLWLDLKILFLTLPRLLGDRARVR